ncbi:MAG TPA: universal stress protein [Streptosporangiaceae bacterium]|nr:universal stress protein [Streptosporangiaceae bacterium]
MTGTDGSEESLRAVNWAAREAALRGAPLRIVSAAAAPPGMITRAGPASSRGLPTSCSASAARRWARRPSAPPRRHPACCRHRRAPRSGRPGRHRERRGRTDASARLPRHRRVHRPSACLPAQTSWSWAGMAAIPARMGPGQSGMPC